MLERGGVTCFDEVIAERNYNNHVSKDLKCIHHNIALKKVTDIVNMFEVPETSAS